MVGWKSVIVTKANTAAYKARFVDTAEDAHFSATLLSRVKSPKTWDLQFGAYPIEDIGSIWPTTPRPKDYTYPTAYLQAKKAGEFDQIRRLYAAHYKVPVLGPSPVKGSARVSVLLQVNFGWDVPAEQAMAIDPAHAQRYAELPGLQWKLWVFDPDTRTNGGIHLFVDRPTAKAYLETLLPRLEAMEGVHDLRATIFDIKEEATRTTRGPLDVPAPDDGARRRDGAAAR